MEINRNRMKQMEIILDFTKVKWFCSDKGFKYEKTETYLEKIVS